MTDPMLQVNTALNRFQQLGNTADLRKVAEALSSLSVKPVNSHIHLPPNFSAFSSVKQAVSLAADEQIRVLGVSNYYDYTVYGTFSELAFANGIFPLYGTELIGMIPDLRDRGVRLNDPGNPGKIYICGKGITKFSILSENAQHWLATIRENDKHRMSEMIVRMSKIFQSHGVDVELSFDQIVDSIAERYGCPRETVWLQERHLAEAFEQALRTKIAEQDLFNVLETLLGKPSKAVELSDAAVIQGELRSALMKSGKAAFVEEQFIELEHALELIDSLGGIPCYPVLADGSDPMCEFEQDPEKLADTIKSLGFLAAELIPIRNAPDVLDRYTKALRQAGLIVTAGTEHNTTDLLPIVPRCRNKNSISEDLQHIFWEGACVVAAHQYLKLNDLPGYSDEDDCSEGRIDDLAKLGEVVIQRYLDQ